MTGPSLKRLSQSELRRLFLWAEGPEDEEPAGAGRDPDTDLTTLDELCERARKQKEGR